MRAATWPDASASTGVGVKRLGRDAACPDSRQMSHDRVAQARSWQKRGSGGGNGASWGGKSPRSGCQGEQGWCHGGLGRSSATERRASGAAACAKSALGNENREPAMVVSALSKRRGGYGVCEESRVLQNGNAGSEQCAAARLVLWGGMHGVDCGDRTEAGIRP